MSQHAFSLLRRPALVQSLDGETERPGEVFCELLRRLGLAGSAMARCYCGTIRTRLLKIGARVRVTVRRIWVSLATAHPAEEVFAHAYERLRRLAS